MNNSEPLDRRKERWFHFVGGRAYGSLGELARRVEGTVAFKSLKLSFFIHANDNGDRRRIVI
jgi:hypothetical protein